MYRGGKQVMDFDKLLGGKFAPKPEPKVEVKPEPKPAPKPKDK